MRLRILESAKEDLIEGYHFYEEQTPGLGAYFLDLLFADIDSLVVYAGIHSKVNGSYRVLSKRFPFAIYYDLHIDEVQVHAVLDCRRRPSWIRNRLKRTS
jgi:plasmid stabilization system protein ParE